jgi:hypothetical protein
MTPSGWTVGVPASRRTTSATAAARSSTGPVAFGGLNVHDSAPGVPASSASVSVCAIGSHCW